MGAPIQDSVVAYDIMWEAANRLTSLHVRQIGPGGIDDPAVREIRSIRAEAEAVDPDNLEAQRTLTADFAERRRALLEAG